MKKLFIANFLLAALSVKAEAPVSVTQVPMPTIMKQTLKSAQYIVIGPEPLELTASTEIEAEHVVIEGDIITNGNYLKILARVLEIRPEAHIMGFNRAAEAHDVQKEQLKAPSQAGTEQRGKNGKEGDKGFKGNDGFNEPGRIDVTAAIIIGLPAINANGQDGSVGAIGQRGQDGGKGGRGKDSKSYWGMVRRKRATPGGRGGDGGEGGPGGDGGNGGRPVPTRIYFGRIFEWTEVNGQRVFSEVKEEQISAAISTEAGQGGGGGPTGLSGRAGRGGDGGSGANYTLGSSRGRGPGDNGKTPGQADKDAASGQSGPEVARDEVVEIDDIFAPVLDAFERKELSEQKFRTHQAADRFSQSLQDWLKAGSAQDLALQKQLLTRQRELQQQAQETGLSELSLNLGELELHSPTALNQQRWDPLESTCRHASLSIL